MFMIKASDLKVGESGIIKEIYLEEQKYFKTLHLGVMKGNKIRCVFESPLKDPIAYTIYGCTFALRQEDADKIMVEYA